MNEEILNSQHSKSSFERNPLLYKSTRFSSLSHYRKERRRTWIRGNARTAAIIATSSGPSSVTSPPSLPPSLNSFGSSSETRVSVSIIQDSVFLQFPAMLLTLKWRYIQRMPLFAHKSLARRLTRWCGAKYGGARSKIWWQW